MRNGTIVLVIAFVALISGCYDLVNSQPAQLFFLENKSGTTVRLLGYSLPSGTSNSIDTLVDTTLNDGANIIIWASPESSRGGKYIGKELCDTMCIFRDDVLYHKSWNFSKASSFDSLSYNSPSTIFYQFYNSDVYVPYDTIYVDGVAKEVQYRFRIE